MTAHPAQTSQHPETVAPGNPERPPDLSFSKADAKSGGLSVSSPEADAPLTSATVPSDPAVVSIAKYQAVVDELARYKAHFGELPELSIPATEGPPDPSQPLTTGRPEDSENASESPLLTANPTPAECIDPEQSREETEQLLSILSVNDRDLAHEVNDLRELLNISSSSPNSPLKHFGFQRGKSANQ
ncbi:hypothetical protein [Vampirovibrio chlorellavorus]|uniref:hypothetical protein n=1 Tax=Vampirovibrio chlorellavorus TaxID=758823 RepID=UPI0026EA9E60|nr:hypothetical protein [Vampirovibrio chlorellavorus]